MSRSASGLEPEGKNEQLQLFASAPQQTDKRRRLGQLLDQLTARYGEDVVRIGETRAAMQKRPPDPASPRKEELLDPLTQGKKER